MKGKSLWRHRFATPRPFFRLFRPPAGRGASCRRLMGSHGLSAWLGALILAMVLFLPACQPTDALDFTFHRQDSDNTNFRIVRDASDPTDPEKLAVLPLGNSPVSLAVGDFDGDGDLDIAVTNLLETTADEATPADPTQPGTLSVLLNDGLGGFAGTDPGFSLTDAGIRPTRVLAGDLNSDGRSDLVYFHQDASLLRVLLSTGSGWSTSEIDLDGTTKPLGQPVAYQAELVDVTGDGKLDILVSLLRESADTTDFSDPEFGDLSPPPDFEVFPGVMTFVNDGAGGFPFSGWKHTIIWQKEVDLATDPPPTPNTSNHPARFVTGDWDGNSFLDLAVLNQGSDIVNFLLGNGDGSFNVTPPGSSVVNTVPVGSRPHDLVTADFDQDGFADIAVSNRSSATISVVWGKGGGVFATPVSLSLKGETNRPEKLVAADFNGDGTADLAVVDRNSHRVAFFEKDISRTFLETTLEVSYDPFDLLVEDVTGDGNLDLLSVETGLRVVSVLAGVGDGTFSRTVIGFDHAPSSVTLADLNGDGFQDLIVLHKNGDSMVVLLNCAGVPCP